MHGENAADRRARADALFARALDLTGEDRASFLAAECAGDVALAAEVEELLAWCLEEPALLARGALGDRELRDELMRELESPRPAHPRRVGPWRLLREIGRGGMGTVYLAERVDGDFDQTAALKLLQAGADAEEVVRRFELERQILASLHHPEIAALFDGGRTDDGRPYFAMEYVEGRPIDAYCDDRQLDVAARLDLFLRVGRAVEHAHANLIVHRDLKPANIVVTDDGRMKLLDFGIAKILDPILAPERPVTRTVARVLTPEYASPEQVRGEPITTASDVYQLGLLLYELLTGRRAHRVRDSTPAALERAVCEEEPTRPSAAATAADSEQSAARRRTTRERLARRLRGDLDNIVLTALRKDPERRYASVGALLEDVERYRQGLPVRARPDTLAYRVRKFAGRHRVGLAFASGVLLLLAALGAYHAARLTRESELARHEADKSQAMLDFLLGTFTTADPIIAAGEAPDLLELLEGGVARARRELALQPQLAAALLDSIGRIYLNLGRVEAAAPLLEEAFALRRETLPAGDPDLARSRLALAALRQASAEYDEAERLAREGLGELRRADAAPELVASALEQVADIRSDLGDYEEAARLYRQSLILRESLEGGDPLELLRVRYRVGTVLFDLGDYPGAAARYREAAEASRAYSAAEGSPLPWALGGLGASLAQMGELVDAEATLREAVDLLRDRVGPSHPDLADHQRSLATTLARLGRSDEAEVLYRDCIEIYETSYGPDHHEVAKTLYDLAQLERDRGRFVAARENIDRTLGILRTLLPADHPHIGRATAGLAWIELEAGREQEALAGFETAVAILARSLPPDHALLLATRAGLGRALLAAGRAEEGCAELQAARSLAGGSTRRTEELETALRLCATTG